LPAIAVSALGFGLLAAARQLKKNSNGSKRLSRNELDS
jgi:hypothetical protein